MGKVLLIGGSPMIGKSTVARKIAAKYELHCLSTDDIGEMMQAVVDIQPMRKMNYLDNVLSGSFFYNIHGKIVKKHKVNDALMEGEPGIDASMDRMQQVNKIIVADVEELTKRCKEFNRDIPTQIKIVYEVNTHKLNTDISYDLKYTNKKGKCWLDTFEEWFEELEKQEVLN